MTDAQLEFMDLRHVLIVTDRDQFARRAIRLISTAGFLPERASWMASRTLSTTPVAALVDVETGFEQKWHALERWAERACQPLCVVSITGGSGTAKFVGRLERLGYEHFRYDIRGPDWAGIGSDLEEIVDGSRWLVTQVARALNAGQPEIVRALTVAIDLIPQKVTVESWARALRMRDQRRLDEMFSDLDLPPPKRVFDFLRLGQGYLIQVRASKSLTRNELAHELGYSSGDYLGRRYKALLGLSVVSMSSLKPADFLELIRQKIFDE